MRKVSRSALVSHSASEMFSLVNDIEAYPGFLPWCKNTVVHSRNADTVEATLELQRGGISKTFTTRNRLSEYESIGLELVDGPFRHLSGGWEFRQLDGTGCKISLNLEFEFESRVTDMVFGSFFEEICNSLVDAFTRRADEVYGEG